MDPKPSNGLSDTEQADLVAALDDEYMARATYAQVIADFGAVRPFVNIVEAERRHAEALLGLFHRYGVPVPVDTWPGRVPRHASIREACEAAVAAEIDNGEMYDRLIAGTDRADILAVYRNLQAASQERHLPAFRRCADRGDDTTGHGTGTGTGDGDRPRRRRRRRGGD
jgi:hypothetical protein